MKFHLESKGIYEVEYYVIVNLVGVLSALYEGAISILDAEQLIFSPGYAEGAEKLGVNANIVKIIWQGTELEDVESLCPEKLLENILKLKTKALALCSKMTRPYRFLERMTVTIDGTTHNIIEGFSDNVKFEDLEEE